ncbi:MAG: hypothetical protein ACKO2P_14350 [Planctomycetota bacterium]
MAEIRRNSVAAVLTLVILRLSIGWQLLYEGLWKIQSLGTPNPWSAEGYLKNAQGPMRPVFRWLTGDPNDTQWLDPKTMSARWDSWRLRFSQHYKLSESQQATLARLVDGASGYSAPLAKLPEGISFKNLRLDDTIRYDAAKKLLIIDGAQHMLPAEKQALDAAVEGRTDPDATAFRSALDAACARASRLSYKERLRAHLLGNPDNAGRIDGRISQILLYQQLLSRYEQKLTDADLPYQLEHLNRTWSDTREKGAELAGPVRALDAELQEEAQKLLSVEQLQLGPLPEPWTILRLIDLATIGGLTGLGLLLLLGLFTRPAAFAAATMIFGFYLAMPPLPGLPEAPGPEHSLIINKNLIEVFALAALACLPTGIWFGLDGVLTKFFASRRVRKVQAAA